MQKYHLPKMGKLQNQFLRIQGMHKQILIWKEYLIPDAPQMILGFLELCSTNGTITSGRLRFDNRKNNTTENGIVGEEGYFKAVDKSFDSFNASLRVQKESC
jgi:iron complex outermembrane receptor protein